jgi:hypothetical protein
MALFVPYEYTGTYIRYCIAAHRSISSGFAGKSTERTTVTSRTRSRSIKKRLVPAAALIALCLAATGQAALNVSAFSVTPSTTQVRGHPDLTVSESFDPPTADVKEIVLHLPAGLTANARAAPVCRRSYLVADLCPLQTKVGQVGLVGIAFGFEAEVARNIYNLKRSGEEALRLGVPLFGSLTRGGASLVLPVRQRPQDHGLDVAVAGPPREVAGYSVQLKQLTFRLKGSVRARIKGRLRRRAFLTNPGSCGPATTALDIVAYEGPPPMLTKVSSFTLTGC